MPRVGPVDAVDPKPQDGTALTYEQARAELAEVVEALEGGGLPLEEALRLWERGEHLATLCQQWLDGARARLDEARAARDGS